MLHLLKCNWVATRWQ